MTGNKGSIPIPYIIAIIFGIAVIAIIGYWFFTVSSSAGGVGSESECIAMKIAWCNEAVAKNWMKPALAKWDTTCDTEPSNTKYDRCIYCRDKVLTYWVTCYPGMV